MDRTGEPQELAAAIILRAAMDATGRMGDMVSSGNTETTRQAAKTSGLEFLLRTGCHITNEYSDFWFKAADLPRPRNLEDIQRMADTSKQRGKDKKNRRVAA